MVTCGLRRGLTEMSVPAKTLCELHGIGPCWRLRRGHERRNFCKEKRFCPRRLPPRLALGRFAERKSYQWGHVLTYGELQTLDDPTIIVQFSVGSIEPGDMVYVTQDGNIGETGPLGVTAVHGNTVLARTLDGQ